RPPKWRTGRRPAATPGPQRRKRSAPVQASQGPRTTAYTNHAITAAARPATPPYPTDPPPPPAQPKAIAPLPYFVAWVWARRDGEWTKVPIDVHTGSAAK